MRALDVVKEYLVPAELPAGRGNVGRSWIRLAAAAVIVAVFCWTGADRWRFGTPGWGGTLVGAMAGLVAAVVLVLILDAAASGQGERTGALMLEQHRARQAEYRAAMRDRAANGLDVYASVHRVVEQLGRADLARIHTELTYVMGDRTPGMLGLGDVLWEMVELRLSLRYIGPTRLYGVSGDDPGAGFLPGLPSVVWRLCAQRQDRGGARVTDLQAALNLRGVYVTELRLSEECGKLFHAGLLTFDESSGRYSATVTLAA